MSDVAIVMGSISDLQVMQNTVDVLKDLQVSYEVKVISAHRTPQEMLDFAKTARSNNFKVIIAGAGGAAHLPGMIASSTSLPVIGVPVPSRRTGLTNLSFVVVRVLRCNHPFSRMISDLVIIVKNDAPQVEEVS